MAACAASRAVEVVETEAGAMVGLGGVRRNRATIAVQLDLLARFALNVGARVHRQEALVRRRAGVSIGLPLFVLAVTQAAGGRSLYPVLLEPFVFGVIAQVERPQRDVDLAARPIRRACIQSGPTDVVPGYPGADHDGGSACDPVQPERAVFGGFGFVGRALDLNRRACYGSLVICDNPRDR